MPWQYKRGGKLAEMLLPAVYLRNSIH